MIIVALRVEFAKSVYDFAQIFLIFVLIEVVFTP